MENKIEIKSDDLEITIAFNSKLSDKNLEVISGIINASMDKESINLFVEKINEKLNP